MIVMCCPLFSCMVDYLFLCVGTLEYILQILRDLFCVYIDVVFTFTCIWNWQCHSSEKNTSEESIAALKDNSIPASLKKYLFDRNESFWGKFEKKRYVFFFLFHSIIQFSSLLSLFLWKIFTCLKMWLSIYLSKHHYNVKYIERPCIYYCYYSNQCRINWGKWLINK
jgi:hypothetical protein